MVKEPKQAIKEIERLHKLVDLLRFYMYTDKDADKFRKLVIGPASKIEDYVREISSDKKITHIRLIQRWEKRQKHLKDQNLK